MSTTDKSESSNPQVSAIKIPLYTPKDPGLSSAASMRQLEILLGMIGSGLSAAASEVQNASINTRIAPPGLDSEELFASFKPFIEATDAMMAYLASVQPIVEEIGVVAERMLKETPDALSMWKEERSSLLKGLRATNPEAFAKVFPNEQPSS
jgi:hypothetical protein